MSKERIKVYIYTCVSTSMQIDGYSLEAQKSRMKAFCEYNNYEIVSFVLVFKLSRFERNAADVLATLQKMQDFGVNLICVEDGIAKYLENHGIHKIARQNGKNPLFDSSLIRKIVQNPVYCGKIAYGGRRTEKVHGTRNDYRQVNKEDYILVDGIYETIIQEDVWEQAQIKVASQAKKYEKVNSVKGEKTHLLSGILRCPVCGAGMYGNKSIKRRKDGSLYKDFFYYGCKHYQRRKAYYHLIMNAEIK